MRKFVCLPLMLLMTSGCCQLFGLCTSVNVHTRASSPDQFASKDMHDSFNLTPASAIVSNQHLESEFSACG
jgi:hypothetical protein